MGTIFSALNAAIEAAYGDSASDSPSAKIYADYVNAGQPSSGQRKPKKNYIRGYLALVEQWVDRKKGILKVTTAGSVTIGDTVREIHVKLGTPGLLVFTIGEAVDRNAFPVRIVDIDRIFGAYPATVTCSGSDTFQASPGNGNASFTLDQDGVIAEFTPTADEDGYYIQLN